MEPQKDYISKRESSICCREIITCVQEMVIGPRGHGRVRALLLCRHFLPIATPKGGRMATIHPEAVSQKNFFPSLVRSRIRWL